MAIEGDLHDMNLAEIIQLNCRNAEEAQVTLRHGRESGTVYFANGQVVHATHEEDTGEEAIYKMLSWQDGRFVIERGVASPQKTVHLPWSVLLLQGMKRFDEEQASPSPSQESFLGKSLETLPAPVPGGGSSVGPAPGTGLRALSEISQERKEVPGEKTRSKQNAQGVLQELADSLDGFVAASVVDAQGIVASLVQSESFDDKQAAAILPQVAERVNAASEAMNAGAFEESITTTEKYLFVTRPLGQGQYYARVVITPDGNIGAARMYLADKEQALLDNLSPGAR